MRSFTREQTRLLRLDAQGLSELGASRWTTPAEAARGCGGVQSQDRIGGLLAFRARSSGLTAAEVERALFDERSIARTWLMRGTLHTAVAADLRWLLALLGPEMDRKALKRRADLGIDDDIRDAALATMQNALAAGRTLPRAEIVERVREAGLPWEDQVVPHLLRAASMRGLICFGPTQDGAETHALLDDWLADIADAQPPDPGAELARRYFAAYGPATQTDFRFWSGLSGADARAAFRAVEGELEEVEADGKPMWMTPGRDAPADAPLSVRVLGPFDPYVLGYAKRELGASEDALRLLHRGGGMIPPIVLADGVLVAVATRRRTARGMRFTLNPVARLTSQIRASLDAELADIARFLNEPAAWAVESA